MLARLQAVLLTYATRRFAWFLAGVGALLVLAMLLSGPGSIEDIPPPIAMVLACPTTLIAYFLASQAKWQFVDPRARSVPRFVGPHLAVLLVLAVIALGFLPWLVMANLTGINALGGMACTIAIAASFIWMNHDQHPLTFVLGMAAFFSLMTKAGTAFWLDPELAADVLVYHQLILAAGWIAVAAWMMRLAGLNEERDDYAIPTAAQHGSATRMERIQANRNVARQLLRHPIAVASFDRWHDRLMGRREVTAQGRQRLLQYGFGVMPGPLQAAGLAIVMFATFYLMSAAGGQAAAVMVPSGLSVMALWPGFIPSQLMATRRARLAQESLLPMTRGQFFIGLYLAMIRMGFQLFLILAMVAVTLILTQSVPLPPASQAVGYVIIALAIQPILFGICAHIARYSSAAAWIGLMLLSMIAAIIPGTICVNILTDFGLTAMLLAAALTAIAGALMIRHSFNAWMNAELA